jgi:HAE1 family hydrophobic/amphiphilic exporter-1
MRFFGYSIDNLSLMALTLAIGFLVDDAIVFLENTVRRMERGERALEASINGAREISFTILSMTVSLAAVFIPLVFMSGQVGRVFREFSVTIIIAILASGIVSLTLTPLMCARMLKDRGPGSRRTWMERVFGAVEKRILAVYGGLLSWFLRWKFISAIIWAACMAGTVFLFMSIPKSMLPAGDSSVVFGVFIAREGSSPEQMRNYQDEVIKVLEADPDVVRSISITGATGFLNSNMGMTFTFLKPPHERIPIQAKAGELMGKIGQIPGLIAGLQPWAVLEIQAGAVNQNQGQYSYAISGVNPAEVYETAGKMMMRLFPIPGTPAGKLFDSMLPDLWSNTPNLELAIRREQAKSQGVSEARILQLLQTAYAQNYVYLIKKPEDQYQVIVEVADKARAKPDDLGLLYIRSDDGQNLVPLSALVDWKQTVGLQAVNHINQFTSVTFSLNIKPGVALGDATKYVEEVAAEIVPPTLRKGFQGQAETFQATMSDLTILLYVAVFVMFVILAILYESYVHPITVLSTLPPALVGGLLALFVFREQATLYAFVGLFMLMGIVKKNGIMIVDFARHRVDAGEPPVKAIHDASMDRFRPIIMTTLAAIMGAVPIALGYGADGASRRPLGLVIVGGLIISQFLTLFVTPVIYLYMESFQRKVLDRIPFFRSHSVKPVAVETAEPHPDDVEVSLSPEKRHV